MELTRTARPIKRIVTPLDGSSFSEQAIPFAQAIAGPETELLLVQVAEVGEPIRNLLGRVMVTADDISQVLIDAAEDNLEQTQREWLGDRSHVRRITAVGDTAEQVTEVADREHADLIVMASHGYGGVRRWVIGSVADQVVRTSRVPVMVIRPTEGDQVAGTIPPIARLIVPYDGSALAAQAFPFAARLARNLNVPILLVNVTEIAKSLQDAMFFGVPLNPELYDEVIAQAQADEQRVLADAADQLRQGGVEVDVLVADGLVADTIATLTTPTDVIVMTSHGRGGLRRKLLGSVAEKLVRQGPVPVVLVPATVTQENPDYADAPVRQRALEPAVNVLI